MDSSLIAQSGEKYPSRKPIMTPSTKHPKIKIRFDTRSSTTNDTSDNSIPLTPSIIHATHKTDPNYYIQKGLDVLKAMHPSQYH